MILHCRRQVFLLSVEEKGMERIKIGELKVGEINCTIL